MSNRLIHVPPGAVALVVVDPTADLEASIHGEYRAACDDGCTAWYIDMPNHDGDQPP